jgi:hypothetical protein
MMVDVPREILAAFGVSERPSVEPGDIFDLQPPHVRYFEAEYARPGVVVHVESDRRGNPIWAYLLYTTTKSVPKRAVLELSQGEGGLRKACRVDARLYKRIAVASLLSDCPKLGRLSGSRRQEIEQLLSISRLSIRVKKLGP